MICPNCKNHVDESYTYCAKCGEQLKKDQNNNYNETHNTQFDYSKNYSNVTNSYNDHHNSQYNYSNLYSNNYQKNITSEEDYLKSYIGNNYNSIKQTNFSLIAFIFGPLYLLYKKMWYYSLILLLIIFAISTQNLNIAALITILINLYLGFKFNSIYLEYANKKVESIKISNPDKSSIEILKVCENKGKNLNIIFVVVIFILFIIGLFYYYSSDNSKEITSTYEKTDVNKDTNDIKEEQDILDDSLEVIDLTYSLPNDFDANKNNTKNSKFYLYYEDEYYCSISIMAYSEYNSSKNFLNSYIKLNEDEIVTKPSINSRIINSNKWDNIYLEYKDNRNEDVYSIVHNNKTYYLKFESDLKDLCKSKNEEFINSLNFKN